MASDDLPPIFSLIGDTPVVAHTCSTEDGPVEVLIKLEGQNPSGSVKDRAGAQMIRHAMLPLDASRIVRSPTSPASTAC
ncbi:MAG: hypothetical protein AAGK32_10805, partial [Actinomycetota bacterium]